MCGSECWPRARAFCGHDAGGHRASAAVVKRWRAHRNDDGRGGGGDGGGGRILLGNVEQTAFFVGWHRHICGRAGGGWVDFRRGWSSAYVSCKNVRVRVNILSLEETAQPRRQKGKTMRS